VFAENQAYAPPTRALSDTLGPPTPEERAIVQRIDARRIALQGDNVLLRDRYDEIMRWINPPWQPDIRMVDPRPDQATAARQGQPVLHADLTGPTVTRWASLQAGAPVIIRARPYVVRPPIEEDDQDKMQAARRQYEIDRSARMDQATQIENQTNDWLDLNDFNRTFLWACWAKEAFGKSILKCGWDFEGSFPTVELMENPSQVYYAWTNRYGRRQLAWAIVADQMDATEANDRFGINIPIDTTGNIDVGQWLGILDQGDMDNRPEQVQELNRMVWAQESWELLPDNGGVLFALVLGGRIVEGPTVYPWKKVPFHVFENEHIPTYLHGKSTAEVMIPLNASYDDMLDREASVIEFESGPRYKGLNMANSGDEVDIPDPFNLIPLREGEDIQQIDTHVDFFPATIHANELREARYGATGLTPIAWGMSPNAQTSGRAMAAEWRAVELPLASKLINIAPEIKGIIESWWEYAEAYSDDHFQLSHAAAEPGAKYWQSKPFRRFQIVFEPLDIRDQNERTQDIIARLNSNLVDPLTAIQESGKENADEILAAVESFLLNPVWNPLRYQQYLTLQQLQLSIRMQAAQVAQAEAAAQAPQGPPPGSEAAPAEQGAQAAAEGAQAPAPVASEGQNQPGGIIPIASRIASQNSAAGAGAGGVQNRALVELGGAGPVAPPTAPPAAGQVPR
jgi:hypothetical protein